MKGVVHVYTGDGKGKTTAAVGLAARALGHGLRVCFITFFKEPEKFGYGELKLLERCGAKVYSFARRHPHFYRDVGFKEVRGECLKALEFVRLLYREGELDLLILDELCIALRDGFLREEEVLKLIREKPEGLELVLTGRGAPRGIIEAADLVTEMMKVKHPYDKGLPGRRGIEF